MRTSLAIRSIGSIMLGVAVLSACTGGTVKPASSNSAGAGDATFVYAPNLEVVTDWDPATSYSNEIIAMQNIYETLTHYDTASGKLSPLLATSWESTNGGKTWTFTLRDDVTFHDGAAMDALIDGLIDQHPPNSGATPATAVCIGGKWETDTLAARMLAHSLALGGLPATHRSSALMTADYIDRLELADAKTVCLSFFSAEPKASAQTFCRRLRRRWPHLRIVLALWNAPSELLDEAARRELGADAVVTSLSEAMMQLAHTLGIDLSTSFLAAPVPAGDAVRIAALHESGLLDGRAQPLLEAASRRVADIFDVPMAMVSLIDLEQQCIPALFGQLPAHERSGGAPSPGLHAADLEMPRAASLCGHVVANGRTMVVPDLARDLRFAGNPALNEKGLRFYAGAPLRDTAHHVLGTLCILDVQPRSLTQRELELLESMADELMAHVRAQVLAWGDLTPLGPLASHAPSATVGQPLPSVS